MPGAAVELWLAVASNPALRTAGGPGNWSRCLRAIHDNNDLWVL